MANTVDPDQMPHNVGPHFAGLSVPVLRLSMQALIAQSAMCQTGNQVKGS